MDQSDLSGFYKLALPDRLKRLDELFELGDSEKALLGEGSGLDVRTADAMIENVVGIYGLPMGIGTNLLVNGKDVAVPMVIEEPSVVAGMSYAARLVRAGGGFWASTTAPEMIGQMQVLDIVDPHAARLAILEQREALLARAAEIDPVMVRLGGGPRDIQVRLIESGPVGPMLVVHLIIDTRDAMGANTINTTLEALSPEIEKITSGRVGLRILSNLADRRLARARCVVPAEQLAMYGLTGQEGVQRIVEAYAFAASDPYRAATHNKGIMNGIDALVVATGNDWRAIEAGAHAYAARGGQYCPLSHWEQNADGDLVGSIELPMALGTVGGATRVHPMARLALKILGVQSATELAEIAASVGLAQNLAALRALAMEGIQQGHMKLHARQVALAAGATSDQVEQVAQQLVSERNIRPERASEILVAMRAGSTD